KPTFAFHGIGFDEEHVTARWSPRQTHSHAGTLRALLDLTFHADLDAAQKFLNDFLCDHKLLGLAFGQPPRLLAADGSDGALQAAHTRLSRVVTNHVTQSFIGKLDLVSCDAVLFHLARNQIASRDVQLLFFTVTLKLYDLH